jgi:hypothetical protein
MKLGVALILCLVGCAHSVNDPYSDELSAVPLDPIKTFPDGGVVSATAQCVDGYVQCDHIQCCHGGQWQLCDQLELDWCAGEVSQPPFTAPCYGPNCPAPNDNPPKQQ